MDLQRQGAYLQNRRGMRSAWSLMVLLGFIFRWVRGPYTIILSLPIIVWPRDLELAAAVLR